MIRLTARSLALFLVAAYCLAPLAWQVITSLKPADELTRLPPLLPGSITTAHYAAVLHGHGLPRIMANSLLVAAGATILAIGIGALAAFALAMLRVKRRALLLAIVLAASMFPPIATVGPLFVMINALHLRDTLAALILAYTSFELPLAIWLLTRVFRSIPHELYVAARIDGCTAFQAFHKIMLPLAAPGLAAAALLVFIFSWNEFLYALSFTATEAARTIPVAIALFPGLHETPWGEIAAASAVVTLPLLVLAFAFQRRIVEGLTTGAIKG